VRVPDAEEVGGDERGRGSLEEDGGEKDSTADLGIGNEGGVDNLEGKKSSEENGQGGGDGESPKEDEVVENSVE